MLSLLSSIAKQQHTIINNTNNGTTQVIITINNIDFRHYPEVDYSSLSRFRY